MEREFVAKLAEARFSLSSEAAQTLVLDIARTDLREHLDAYVTRHRRLVVGVA